MSSNNSGNSNPIAGALTFPSRSENDVHRAAEQPRQPRNLQGLLRFAMEATKAEDAPGNSDLGPMDEERRKFLEDALKSLTVNVAQMIHNSIKVLTNTQKIHSIQLEQELPTDVQTSFNNLLEYIDDIDTANDFYKMGGFAMFPICYGSENDQVRALASTVLAELCQNNPFCQSRALECGLLNVLLNLMQSERKEALAKCLYAVSCAIREFEPSCRELISQGGCEPLGRLLQDTEQAVRTKSAFLIRYLCHNYNDAKEEFIERNLVKTIADQLRLGRDGTSEHLLSILLTLTEDLDSRVLGQCRDPDLQLKKTLELHLRHPELDNFREEREYCQDLLKRLFDGRTQSEEVADR